MARTAVQASLDEALQRWMTSQASTSRSAEPQPTEAAPLGRRGAAGGRTSQSQTGYSGVTRHKRTQRFEAHIWIEKKQVYLGAYDSPVQAAKAHDIMCLRCKPGAAGPGGEGHLNFAVQSAYQDVLPLLQQVAQADVVAALRGYSKSLGARGRGPSSAAGGGGRRGTKRRQPAAPTAEEEDGRDGAAQASGPAVTRRAVQQQHQQQQVAALTPQQRPVLPSPTSAFTLAALPPSMPQQVVTCAPAGLTPLAIVASSSAALPSALLRQPYSPLKIAPLSVIDTLLPHVGVPPPLVVSTALAAAVPAASSAAGSGAKWPLAALSVLPPRAQQLQGAQQWPQQPSWQQAGGGGFEGGAPAPPTLRSPSPLLTPAVASRATKELASIEAALRILQGHG